MSYCYQRRARRPATVLALGGVWVGLVAAWSFLDAAWWILLPVFLLTLPALHDLYKDARAGFEIDAAQGVLRWSSTRSTGSVPLQAIDHVRFDTRMDLALNARLQLADGRSLRLPPECVPPFRDAIAALDEQGIAWERHHFGLR